MALAVPARAACRDQVDDASMMRGRNPLRTIGTRAAGAILVALALAACSASQSSLEELAGAVKPAGEAANAKGLAQAGGTGGAGAGAAAAPTSGAGARTAVSGAAGKEAATGSNASGPAATAPRQVRGASVVLFASETSQDGVRVPASALPSPLALGRRSADGSRLEVMTVEGARWIASADLVGEPAPTPGGRGNPPAKR